MDACDIIVAAMMEQNTISTTTLIDLLERKSDAEHLCYFMEQNVYALLLWWS